MTLHPAETAAVASARSAHAVALRAAPWRRRLVRAVWVIAALPFLSVGTWIAIHQRDVGLSEGLHRPTSPSAPAMTDEPGARFEAKACGAVYRITLAPGAGVSSRAAYQFKSCGLGRIDLPPFLLVDDESLRIDWLRVDITPAALRLRVALFHHGAPRVYDTDSVPRDRSVGPGVRVGALPVSGDASGMVVVTFEPVVAPDHLALDLVDQPAAQALAIVARAAGVVVDGDAGTARITLRQDGMLTGLALAQIAEVGGRSLRRIGDGHYRLEPPAGVAPPSTMPAWRAPETSHGSEFPVAAANAVGVACSQSCREKASLELLP